MIFTGDKFPETGAYCNRQMSGEFNNFCCSPGSAKLIHLTK